MNRLAASAIEFANNAGIRRWVGRLSPWADRWWYAPLAACLAAAATLSMAIPVGPLLVALVALNPRRWRAVVLWAVLGSAIAGAVFTHMLGHFGTAWIAERLPQLVASRHWHYLVSWVSSYGLLTLAGVAASPLSQTPALMLAALLGMPWFDVLTALLLGKALKYFVLGAAAARTASNGLAALDAHQRRSPLAAYDRSVRVDRPPGKK